MAHLNEKRLKQAVFVSLIAIVALLSLAFGVLYTGEKYTEVQEDLVEIEARYLQQQELLLKSLVHLQIEHIDHRRHQIEKRQQQLLQTRVSEAQAIANNLLKTNAPTYGLEKTKIMVREALRPVRFNEGKGYYFIFDENDQLQLYPPDPAKEGGVTREVFEGSELDAYLKISSFSRKYQEGFIKYPWGSTDQSDSKPKISYLAKLHQLGWSIGSGSYIAELEEAAKKEIALELAQPGTNVPDDYFFVYDLHDLAGGERFATMLINPNRPDLVAQTLSDEYHDVYGYAFRKDILKGLREKGEATVTYWYPKPGSAGPQKKISYFKLYPQWNWIIAKGTYLDDLQALLQHKKNQLYQQVQAKFIHFSLLFCSAVVLVLGIAWLLTRNINALIEGYREIQAKQQNRLEQINKILHKQATTDRLTGLANRQYFNRQLGREIARAKRYHIDLSLVFFDIDHFKNINDQHGHLKGDEVLRELSALITKHKRESDLLARWGGEEFALLLPETAKPAAFTAGEKLRELVAHHCFSDQLPITCSFGITQFFETESAGDFINRCDQALYDAKDAGRNTTCSR